MRLRFVLPGLLVLAVAAAPALAKVKNHVQVGVQGRNDTRGYSSQLYVDVTSPSPYDAGCCTDSDSGEWNGPPYAAAQKADLGGTSNIVWSVVFTRRASSAGKAAHDRLIHHWPSEPAAAMGVPLVSKGWRVATIPAVAWVTEEPGANSAQVEGAIGFPLCAGVYAVADFTAEKPDANTTNGVYGDYQIENGRPSDWNRSAVVESLKGVVLDGYLPPRRLTASGAKGAVSGRLTDCGGHAMPYATVSVGPNIVHTSTSGAYRVKLRPGTYTVVARVGGYTIRSAAVRVS